MQLSGSNLPSTHKSLSSSPSMTKKSAGKKNAPGELVRTTGLWILHFRPCSHCGTGSKNLSPKGFSGVVTDDDGLGPELEKHFVRPYD